MDSSTGISPLRTFVDVLKRPDLEGFLRSGLVGEGTKVDGPFGPNDLVYADYIASGRALMQVERFILEEVLPYYANSHTEASYCGGFMTRLRREARRVIAASCGAGEDYAVIFTGAGATAGANRLVHLLGADRADGKRIRVILGPYEHHSNILPWRESSVEIVEIAEAATGGPNLDELARVLASPGDADRTICSFSAASNVTGIVTDVAVVTRLVKDARATMVWDYAAGAPYLPISLSPAPGAGIDAIILSPHKFIGGPAASGILIVRRDAVVSRKPTWTGGGTVKFVSPEVHDYSDSIEAREEAGTPNVVGDIRAALAFLVKDAIGTERIGLRNAELTSRAIAAWKKVEGLELLGPTSAERLPIFSFRVRDGEGGYIHQQLVTRMLSDCFGIQARGGCACAGPYVHRLLSIDAALSDQMRRAILDGEEIAKPGFTRLNLSFLMRDEKVDFILNSVAKLVTEAPRLRPFYEFDRSRAIFFPKAA